MLLHMRAAHTWGHLACRAKLVSTPVEGSRSSAPHSTLPSVSWSGSEEPRQRMAQGGSGTVHLCSSSLPSLADAAPQGRALGKEKLIPAGVIPTC